MFSLLNAGINIASNMKGMTPADKDISSFGYNELGAYLEGAQASEESYAAADNFLKDNPFLATLFPDMEQVKQDASKIDDFEKEVKTREYLQAKEMADAKINSAQEEYYDKELQKKLEQFRKDVDKSDPYYDVKKDKVMEDHKAWIRQRETELLEAKHNKQDELGDAAAKRREEFFKKFTDISKDGFTEEANKKRMDLLKEYGQQEDKFALKDQQDLLAVQGEGFPGDSNVNEVIKAESKNFEQITHDYRVPDGAKVPDDVRQAHFRMEDFQKKMYANLEKWTSGDLSFVDEGMDDLRKKFLTGGFGNSMNTNMNMNNMNDMMQSLQAQASQYNNFMTRRDTGEESGQELGIDITKFKFDSGDFQFGG